MMTRLEGVEGNFTHAVHEKGGARQGNSPSEEKLELRGFFEEDCLPRLRSKKKNCELGRTELRGIFEEDCLPRQPCTTWGAWQAKVHALNST
ncbi:MAG: hypothetical protein JXJ19_00470 [Elusimicrobia bacterium]|nr:hypothetical protein [Elusimicrobiota bacterium]